jgi:hypothetical protein
MAKEDFCYTHYDGDEARDMAHLNRLERGAYTDIRVAQRKFGRLSIERIKKFLSKDFDLVWESLEAVLSKDDKGLYYIEWLENSLNQRKKNNPASALNGVLGGRPPKEYYIYKSRIENTLNELDIDEEIDHLKLLKAQAEAFEDKPNSRIYAFCLKFLFELKNTEERIKQRNLKKPNQETPASSKSVEIAEKSENNLNKPKNNLSETYGETLHIHNGDVNEDEYINTGGMGDFVQVGIAPEMLKTFTQTFTSYPVDRDKDFKAAVQIAIKIGKLKGWQVSEVIRSKKNETVFFWEQIVHHIATDKWFSTRSLSDLNNEWQRLIQSFTNSKGEVKIQQPKDNSVAELIRQKRAS